MDADVVVIGAGTIGTAVAWQLARRGIKNVILIDRNQVGSANTSKAASLMTMVRTKEALVPLIQETYQNIDEIEQLTGNEVGKNQVGTLHVSATPESEANLEQIIKIASKYNIKHKLLSREEVKTKVPWLEVSGIRKALFTEEDAYVDGHLLAQAYASAAKILGVTILQHTEVSEIIVRDGKIIAVDTTKGLINCGNVVDAAGAWANLLSLKIDVSIPMAPVRSIYWITENNEKLFNKDQPMIVLPDAMAYSRPEGGGSLLFGLREKNSPHFHPEELNKEPNVDFLGDPNDRWNIILENGQKFHEFFPDFENIGIAHCITGISTYTPDGYYSFGQVNEIEGFYIAAGCAGAGVAGAGGIGRMVAEMIAGVKPFADPKPFSIYRFGAIDPLSASFRQRCADARSNKKDGG